MRSTNVSPEIKLRVSLFEEIGNFGTYSSPSLIGKYRHSGTSKISVEGIWDFDFQKSKTHSSSSFSMSTSPSSKEKTLFKSNFGFG